MPENESISRDTPPIKDVGQIADLISKRGVGAIIFALPTVIGCFGLYFLGKAINDSQVSMIKVSVGMFATVFGSGLCILLLYLFTNWKLWELLGLSKFSPGQQKSLGELEARAKG